MTPPLCLIPTPHFSFLIPAPDPFPPCTSAQAIALSIHLDTDQKLLGSAVSSLGRFLSSKESNVRYG